MSETRRRPREARKTPGLVMSTASRALILRTHDYAVWHPPISPPSSERSLGLARTSSDISRSSSPPRSSIATKPSAQLFVYSRRSAPSWANLSRAIDMSE